MAGTFACLSVDKSVYGAGKPETEVDLKFARDLFWLIFYLHHISNRKFGGMATLSPVGAKEPIIVETHSGEFGERFERELKMFRPSLGIGHIGSDVRQPYLMKESPFPFFAICFSGGISNRKKIISLITEDGFGLGMIDDVALIAQLIVKKGWDDNKTAYENFKAGITYMTEQIEGAYALAILTEEEIYVVRGPDGHETLSLGEKEGAVAIASESCCFFNQGFKLVRDLEPGEMVVLNNGQAKSLGIIKTQREISSQVCSFGWVYTFFPATVSLGISAMKVREILGAKLAKRDIVKKFFPHFVIDVPDSGRFSFFGYLNEFARANNAGEIGWMPYLGEPLVKYPDVGRSFLEGEASQRNMVASKKLVPTIEVNSEVIKKYLRPGQKKIVIVVLDDSIVRGTQMVNDLVPKIRAAFASVMPEIQIEIHLRISNPKLLSHCPWGKALKKGDNLAAVDESGNIRSAEEIAVRLGVDSCFFTTRNDLAEAIGIPLESLCVDCDKQH